MRFLCFLFSVVATLNLYGQHLTVGDQVPDFSLQLLGADNPEMRATELRGKAILLDFWATWCGPCVSSMPKLNTLQQSFADQLQVVAVSEEKEDRLLRFMANTEYDFRFARDTGRLRELFHYQVIPHTVLIAPDGTVVAITAPENITRAVIEKVLEGQPVDLPLKEDRQDFDPAYDYFQADTMTRSSFALQPHKPALPSFSREYWDGPFKHRRFTVFNLTLDGLYRHAYQMSSYRVELELDESLVDWEEETNRYCMDIIVPDSASLYPTLRQELAAAVPVQARLEKRVKEVVVIATVDGKVVAPEGSPTVQYEGRGDGFKSTGTTVGGFCTYLEDFGIFGYPVVDESDVTGAYSIDFSFQPEDSASFKAEMARYGLTYKKEEREIEVLVLYLEE